MSFGDSPNLTLVKLGGSLLTLPDLADRIQHFIEDNSPISPVILVGGGEAAELVRKWDQRFKLDDEQAHNLAIEAMSFNARLVRSLLPGAQLVVASDEIQDAVILGRVPVVDASAAVVNVEQTSSRLPRTWDVTSDSIAVWLAKHWEIEQIVLLKSADAANRTASQLAEDQAVDMMFAEMIAGMSEFGWVNLRSESSFEIDWIPA